MYALQRCADNQMRDRVRRSQEQLCLQRHSRAWHANAAGIRQASSRQPLGNPVGDRRARRYRLYHKLQRLCLDGRAVLPASVRAGVQLHAC